jgi:integrase
MESSARKHLLRTLARRLMHTLGVDDVAALLTGMRTGGSEKTAAEAFATLDTIVRFAIPNGWIADNPVSKLESDERPRPTGRRQRVLGRDEIQQLLGASLPRYRPRLATVLYSVLRISELLGLVWDDVDLAAGVIRVRAQVSRAHRATPARRVAPKTPAIRDVPLVSQLAEVLDEHRRGSAFAAGSDSVFSTGCGTPLGHRNVERRALQRVVRRAGLDGAGQPPLRFHDLRHTFASHLIVRLARRSGAGQPHPRPRARDDHARRVHAPLRRGARHATEIRAQMAQSAFAQLLETGPVHGQKLVAMPGGRAT